MRKHRVNNLTIRSKLLLIYFFCVLIPIIMTDAIVLYTVGSNAKIDKQKEMQYLMDRIQNNLRETVNDSIMFAGNMYLDGLLDNFLNEEYESHLDYFGEYVTLLRYNNLNYNYSNGLLTRMVIYSDNKTILTGGRLGNLDKAKDTNWYKAYVADGQDTMMYIYYDSERFNSVGTGSSRTLSIIKKLDRFSHKGITNILKVDINYNAMWQDVLDEQIDADIYVRNDKYLLFSNTEKNRLTPFMPADSIKFSEDAVSRKFINGRQDWEIIVDADNDFWINTLNNKGLISLVLANILLPSVLILVVGKSISRRISIIEVHMDKVKQERFEEIQGVSGTDEIGELIRSYNIMISKIRNLIQVVFKDQAEKQNLELSRKQAELKAVQSQVNPHFLFNTLESVRMRSLLKGEEETADIIGEMAALFRRSMSWGSDYITIEEETSFIEKYIKVQRYRFGDKIKYNHYIMEGCEKYLVPKLSIGTFVENACIHGIETTAEDGVISLNITKDREYLFIEISDNGSGVNTERLSMIRSMMENTDSSMLNDAKSTGMLNAFLRFKMYCEGEAVFGIDSEKGSGTDITIRLPLERLGMQDESEAVDLGRRAK